MADDPSSFSHAAAQKISLTIGNQQDVAFEALSALNVETQIIEYRHGNSPVFYPIKMPGLGKVGKVALRNVVLTESSGFREWHAAYENGLIKPLPVIITVSDEAGSATLVWTLHNAWAAKITGAKLADAESGVTEVEGLEFACEAITVSAGKA